MRGVDCADILRTAEEAPKNVPFHIHAAEQLKEIEDSLDYLGKRPIEWLLDNLALNERFHLVHATHLTADEIRRLAKTGANVVLCPSTEGNLGDGIFPLREFQSSGGNWSLGTDSHIGLNPLEELRILDYGQRLTTHKRDIFAGEDGLHAIHKATVAGRKAMNSFDGEFFRCGSAFDACIVKAESPLLANVKTKHLTDSIVYTADATHIHGSFVGGKLIEKGEKYQSIKERFIRCMKDFR